MREPRSKARADGQIYRSVYVELDEDTFQILLAQKHKAKGTYAEVITRALHTTYGYNSEKDEQTRLS